MDRQLGFKVDHSTYQCTCVCEKNNNLYNKEQSDVYLHSSIGRK